MNPVRNPILSSCPCLCLVRLEKREDKNYFKCFIDSLDDSVDFETKLRIGNNDSFAYELSLADIDYLEQNNVMRETTRLLQRICEMLDNDTIFPGAPLFLPMH